MMPIRQGVVSVFVVGDIVRAPMGNLYWQDYSKISMEHLTRGRVKSLPEADHFSLLKVICLENDLSYSFDPSRCILDVEWAFAMAKARRIKTVIRERKKRRKRAEREASHETR